MIANLNREAKPKSVIQEGRIIATGEPYLDRTKEYEWLDQHRYKCRGQWIAVMGDQLVAHGPVAKDGFAEARRLGHPRALFIFVEKESLPFVNI